MNPKMPKARWMLQQCSMGVFAGTPKNSILPVSSRTSDRCGYMWSFFLLGVRTAGWQERCPIKDSRELVQLVEKVIQTLWVHLQSPNLKSHVPTAYLILFELRLQLVSVDLSDMGEFISAVRNRFVFATCISRCQMKFHQGSLGWIETFHLQSSMSKQASDAEVTDVECSASVCWATMSNQGESALKWPEAPWQKTLRMAKGLFSSGLSEREIHSMSDWYEHLDAGSCFVLDEILMPQETLQGKQYNVVPTSFELLFQYDYKTANSSRVEGPLLQHVYLTRKGIPSAPSVWIAIFGPTSSEATGVERLIQIQISQALLTRCRTCSIVG